ncbi:hypothetical protein LINGRAHAP2_LOCUS17023 [Linum grandiflorum]
MWTTFYPSVLSLVASAGLHSWLQSRQNGGLIFWIKIMKYSASHGVQELFIHAPYAALEGVFRSVCDCYRSLKVLELERTYIDNTDVALFSRLQLLESLTLTGCNLCFGDA